MLILLSSHRFWSAEPQAGTTQPRRIESEFRRTIAVRSGDPDKVGRTKAGRAVAFPLSELQQTGRGDGEVTQIAGSDADSSQPSMTAIHERALSSRR